MITFNEVIGYDTIKEDLKIIVDVLKGDKDSIKQGVPLIKGLLLYGGPGVGKTMMATALINESNRKVFICKKDEIDSDFIRKIKNTFKEASNNTPSIVFLDDLDKFAKNDKREAEYDEYVTVQSCIDEVSDKDVFVLATANKINYFPKSLLRVGRFDKIIKIDNPNYVDTVKIIAYYLEKKEFIKDIDIEFMGKLMHGYSCAEIEQIINDTVLLANYNNSNVINIDCFIEAYMRRFHDITNNTNKYLYNKNDIEIKNRNLIAYHEAGHLVVYEILNPGTVLLATINGSYFSGGFVKKYEENTVNDIKSIESRIVGILGGKAAVELKFGILDLGAKRDISMAENLVNESISRLCCFGFNLYRVFSGENPDTEKIIRVELEKYYQKAKEIIFNNMEFLDKVANALLEKQMITSFDIEEIKSNCKINYVSI
ncbi:MAG: AAA family ATPase [Bacillota bacterium]|jgi:cell division protease FtsH|nr:AAA family ATPase [Bacillota bacterium]NLP22405.1 AAA family ATPase [Erysipelotrichaceae bacterium]